MKHPLVSIVIPIFNTEAFLPKCLDSILEQSWQELEIVLVDDGSTDNSLAVCEEYRKRDPRICVTHQENQGVSAARNTGIDQAHGEFITFVDADDWVERDHIAGLVQGIADADCSVCGYVLEWPAHSEMRGFESLQRITADVALEKMLAPELFQGFLCNKLFFLPLIRENGIRLQSELTHYEDLLFCAEYFNRCFNVRVTERATYHYRQRNDSAVGYRKADERWLAGRKSALAALERLYPLCKTPEAKRMCAARMQLEYADMFRRLRCAEGKTVRTEKLRMRICGGWRIVRTSPLGNKFKVKYLSTVLLPGWASCFWVWREDRGSV